MRQNLLFTALFSVLLAGSVLTYQALNATPPAGADQPNPSAANVMQISSQQQSTVRVASLVPVANLQPPVQLKSATNVANRKSSTTSAPQVANNTQSFSPVSTSTMNTLANASLAATTTSADETSVATQNQSGAGMMMGGQMGQMPGMQMMQQMMQQMPSMCPMMSMMMGG